MRKLLLYCMVVFASAYAVGAYADFFDPAAPFHTSLISKSFSEKNQTTDYQYDTIQSKANVESFYRDQLSKQGYSEQNLGQVKPNTEKVSLYFINPKKSKTVTVIFMPRRKGDEKLRYAVYITKEEIPQSRLTAFSHLTKPERVDFMPFYSGITMQIEHKMWPPNAQSIGYMSRDRADTIIDFYNFKMPDFGWQLVKKEVHDGSYEVIEAIKLIAPRSQFCGKCSGTSVMDTPPVRLHGATLEYANDKKRCVITVHTFEDMLQLWRGSQYQERFDLTPMENYGSTIIGVIYYDE